MTQREIQGHLEEIYGVEVSPSLISTVTGAVLDEARAWQARPLDAIYPILYLDALQVKVKSQGRVINKAIYLAFGVNSRGLKEVLGMWASDAEGAKFWLSVVTELKNRDVQGILIPCVDWLKGFPEAIEAVFPQTQVQPYMVHLVRHSLSYVSHRDRKWGSIAQPDKSLPPATKFATLSISSSDKTPVSRSFKRVRPLSSTVEQRTHNPLVVGSNPAGAIKILQPFRRFTNHNNHSYSPTAFNCDRFVTVLAGFLSRASTARRLPSSVAWAYLIVV
jgi:hypothetical protein